LVRFIDFPDDLCGISKKLFGFDRYRATRPKISPKPGFPAWRRAIWRIALPVVGFDMSSDLEWRSLRLRLEALKETVAEEIRGYPPSITACDTHFNYLLELRRSLPRELARLDIATGDRSITIEDFIRNSPNATALAEFLPES
jgi:hypothetical protein